MAKEINWIQGDILETNTAQFIFTGQERGQLYFTKSFRGTPTYHWSIKQVTEMIKSGDWRQLK